MNEEPTAAAKPRRRKAAPAPDAAPASEAPATEPAMDEAPVPGIDEDGEDIVAEVVEIHQGAVGRVEASELGVTLGAVGLARAERVDVERGAVGAALAGTVSVTQGAATTVLASEVHLEQAFARTVVAGLVRVEKPSAVGVLLAGRVEGEVRPILDWRGALALGAVVGLVLALVRRSRD